MLGLTACTTLQRSHQSGYSDFDENYYSPANDYFDHQIMSNMSEAKKQLNIGPSARINQLDADRVSKRVYLNRLEKNISTKQQRLLYYRLKPYFSNDDKKIEFLQLPNFNAKKTWSEQNNIEQKKTEFSAEIITAIEEKNIIPGMTKKAVLESWGEPDFTEIAGNKIYNNERWNYIKHIGQVNGYKKELRTIIFDSGRVAGWETHSSI